MTDGQDDLEPLMRAVEDGSITTDSWLAGIRKKAQEYGDWQWHEGRHTGSHSARTARAIYFGTDYEIWHPYVRGFGVNFHEEGWDVLVNTWLDK